MVDFLENGEVVESLTEEKEQEVLDTEYKSSIAHISNIIEGGLVKRFVFTDPEKKALAFALGVLKVQYEESEEN